MHIGCFRCSASCGVRHGRSVLLSPEYRGEGKSAHPARLRFGVEAAKNADGMDAPSVDIEDPASLRQYLRDSGRVNEGEALEIRTLAGGVSNKTVLVRRRSGEAWVLKQALPKLRTKADWFSDPARIRREALGLEWLPKLAPAGTITPLVFRDDAQNLLAMEAVP